MGKKLGRSKILQRALPTKQERIMKTAILWFRNDLRMHDNEALTHACKEGWKVLPVYILPERELQTGTWGFSKMGIRRLRFVLESVKELSINLEKIGLPLQFRIGDPAHELAEMAIEIGARHIFVHAEAATEEAEDERRLEEKGFSLKRFYGQSLIHPEDVVPGISQLPRHFTPFRQKMEAHLKVRDLQPTPVYSGQAWEISPSPIPQAEELLPDQKEVPHSDFYTGGEQEALRRLAYYFEESGRVWSYKETRNGLLGSDYSSRFSAWLAVGALSPRLIYHRLKAYEAQNGANESTYWLVFELLWRDFFRFSAMKAGNAFFRMQRNEPAAPPNPFWTWTEGKTAHPFANACMKELTHTGYLSNRGRQNAASYLIHDLSVAWTYGAAFFEHHLIDYDVYSNYGNWMYLARVGADPRKDRRFNLDRQAEMYDPNGEYVRFWL